MSEGPGDDDATSATVTFVVPATLDDQRVDRVLAMLTGLSRSEVRVVVRHGAVRLDGVVVTKESTTVREGVRLDADLPRRRSDAVEADASVPVDVVLEDQSFLVINKGAGQVVHPSAGQRDHTLIGGVVARYPDVATLSETGPCAPHRPGVVHRLDKGTSGLLVVARTPGAFDSLSSQLRARTMRREYVGLVQGHLAHDRGVVDAPIGRSARNPTLMTVRSDGRVARTSYEVIDRLNLPDAVTLVRFHLETGRTHQIRVHLSSIGHPLVNDRRYGHHRDPRLEAERVFLHSRSLGFRHPDGDDWVETTVALPDDLRSVLPSGVIP